MAEQATVTVGQVIEFVNKQSREQIAFLEKILSGDIARKQLQQMITHSTRSPKERLARSLLRKAQSPKLFLARFQQGGVTSQLSVESFAEIAAVYELLGDDGMAEKITYQSGGESAVYLARIKALCEKNNLERARMLANPLLEDSRSLAWAAIAGKSQMESDYDHIESNTFPVRLAIAVSRAKTDGTMLQEMHHQAGWKMNDEYFTIFAAIIKEFVRCKDFQTSRRMIDKLDAYNHLQLETVLALARASKDPQDIALYRELIVQAHGNNKSAVCRFADIAAITGEEKDFAACHALLDKQTKPRDTSDAYSALALAYAERGDMATAQEIATKKIIVPDVEATTLACIAHIVLSRPD